MIIIGERINASRKSIAHAISSEDADYIQNEAKAQAEAGADYIEINAGTFVGQEAERLRWLISVVQEVNDLPLCIDSSDPQVIRSVVPLLKTQCMINSITLEPTRLEGILPLAIDYKARVIGLCQSEDLLAETTEKKVELASKLVEKVLKAGMSLDDLYIDPLVYPLATDHLSALAVLDAIQKIMDGFPGVHTICAISNLSHGLPKRTLVNRAFLVAAVARGLDSAIMDPTDKGLYKISKTALMVVGKDDFCMEYITAFREGKLE